MRSGYVEYIRTMKNMNTVAYYWARLAFAFTNNEPIIAGYLGFGLTGTYTSTTSRHNAFPFGLKQITLFHYPMCGAGMYLELASYR